MPQNIIHGFRTVVADIGANIGYIVSSNGFQRGAFQASELTNLELSTWQEFQDAFEESWYKEYFSPTIAEKLDPLLTYAEPFFPKWFSDLSEENKQRYVELKRKYDEFGWLVMKFTPYARFGRDDTYPALPVADRLPKDSGLLSNVPNEVLGAKGYREFFDSAISFGEKAIAEFRNLRDPVT